MPSPRPSETSPAHWIVHKFGGSSLADGAGYRAVASILASQPESRLAVVVSAMSGVTDALIELNRLAAPPFFEQPVKYCRQPLVRIAFERERVRRHA